MYIKFGKRTLDIIIAITILVVTLPITLFVALAIRLESKGPALFTQLRTGVGGHNFKLKKFRSMTVDNDVRDLTKGNQITLKLVSSSVQHQLMRSLSLLMY